MPRPCKLSVSSPTASETTPRKLYESRRDWLKMAGASTLGMATGWLPDIASSQVAAPGQLASLTAVASEVPGSHSAATLTPYKDVTNYNNFYEFGLDKTDPAYHAHRLKTAPWQVQVDGLVVKPRSFGIEELLALSTQEERIYRMRCVEGWSMVIPWIGYSLSELLKQVEPLGSAKYVAFTTQADRDTMPGLRARVIDWPYTEGLRLDEALHPLTLLAFGLYGEILPNQNGAPVRLVVPWKYGFKSAKSIVRISLTEQEPATAWNKAAANEYGFYSNVNPQVAHPRWSQATERRIGEGGLFAKRHETLLFNGYAEQVGQLYTGMDLKKLY